MRPVTTLVAALAALLIAMKARAAATPTPAMRRLQEKLSGPEGEQLLAELAAGAEQEIGLAAQLGAGLLGHLPVDVFLVVAHPVDDSAARLEARADVARKSGQVIAFLMPVTFAAALMKGTTTTR